MKKWLKILVITVMIAVILMQTLCADNSPEDKDHVAKYNVVLVMDASGSMLTTDPQNYRYDAIDLFVGLITNGGNWVGSVVYNDAVVSEMPPREIKSKQDKFDITGDIKAQEAKWLTDTGGALLSAVNMLQEYGNESLPSIVVLLSDGEIQQASEEKLKKSIENKETAMEIAREQGIQIYTICLNYDNEANPEEMAQIANATGGQFREITDAADLQSVFDLYYNIIFTTSSQELVNQAIPAGGVLSSNFFVADVGVEEVNIAVFGSVDRYDLESPSGVKYTEKQIEDISYVTDRFQILKINDPETGIWKLDVYGESGSTIRILKIYNPNLGVKVNLLNAQTTYKVDENIDFAAQMTEGSVPLSEIATYNGYSGVLTVRN